MNKDYFTNSKKKLLIIGGVLLIAVALPITLYLVRLQQELRGRAATPDKLETEQGVLSSSGVTIASDSLASGGQYILFVPTPTNTPTPSPTNIPTPTPTPSISPTSTPTPTPQPGTISAFIESGGSVVMEGENNDAHIRRAGYRWDGACCDTGGSNTSLTGFAGSGFIETRPNDDLKTFFESAYNQGPEVVYNINFTTTGTYYVYLRTSGPDNKSDSAHVGLDGKFAGAMALYFIGEGGATSNWKWKSNNNDGTRTKISVTTPGVHTFHIFMREDGVKVDRIRLFTNPDWVANPNDSAQGPAESPKQ